MYRFDCSLIGRLPNLLRKTKGDVAEMLNTDRVSFAKWEKGDLPCESLVRICNTYRISLSQFIKIGNTPETPGIASDYMAPADGWMPVEWHNEVAGTLFGYGSLTGITKGEAAKRLGLVSRAVFSHWAKSPTALRVAKLVEMLNEFQLDASLFFKDPNGTIPLPAWEVGNKHIADIVAERLEGYRELEKKNAEKLNTIRTLTEEVDMLRRENRALRSKMEGGSTPIPRGSVLAESEVAYRSPFGERGYVFHRKLWESLPEMFEMTAADFCREIGLGLSSFYSQQNIHVDVLLAACNLLRISATHFFVPKNEPLVVHERVYYQMSPRMFVSVESKMERMKYLFGRYGATGYTIESLQRLTGVGRDAFNSMNEGEGARFRVLTLADICTKFNIPPTVFIHDENRKKPTFSESINERLILNAIEMEKEIEELRARIRKTKGTEA